MPNFDVPLPSEAPLTKAVRWTPSRRFNPFRMMRLNTVGWSALVAAGIALAIPGLLLGWSPVICLPTAIAALFIAVWLRDYWAWRRSWTGLGVPMVDGVLVSDDEAERLAARLRAQGFDVSYDRPAGILVEGEPALPGSLRCRAPDVARVRRALGWPDVPKFRRML